MVRGPTTTISELFPEIDFFSCQGINSKPRLVVGFVIIVVGVLRRSLATRRDDPRISGFRALLSNCAQGDPEEPAVAGGAEPRADANQRSLGSDPTIPPVRSTSARSPSAPKLPRQSHH